MCTVKNIKHEAFDLKSECSGRELSLIFDSG